MASRCRHRWGCNQFDGDGDPVVIRCQRCGDYVSLGPSNDDSEAVRVEMRAAELVNSADAADFADCEWMGWNGDEVYSSGGSYHTVDKLPLRNLREWCAGYLARCIATHDDGEGWKKGADRGE